MNQELLKQIREIRNGEGDNSLPVYLRIRKALEELILSGALPDGCRLPPDRKLSEMLNTTHITLGKALNELRDQGLLGRSRSLGTFVKAPREQAEIIPGERNKLVAVGDSYKEVYAAAVKQGIEEPPLTMQVPGPEDMEAIL